jgi:hypothetical protein
VIEGNYLWQLLGVTAETLYLGGLVAVETDGDHRLETNAQYGRFDIGVEATEDARSFETSDPL